MARGHSYSPGNKIFSNSFRSSLLVQLNCFFPAFFSPLPLSASSLPAHSSCSGHGQRQRQRGCRSPGGDNRKGGGACGCTW